MIEAARTTASAGAIWAIVIVAMCCLAFWLIMVAWADRHPVWRGRRVSEMAGPVLGGMHLGSGGRSVSPNREAPSVLTDVDEVPYDQRDYEPEHEIAAQWAQAEPGTQPWGQGWVPLQRGAQPHPAPPAQRSGEADRTERSATGPAERGDES